MSDPSHQPDGFQRVHRGWITKFAGAFLGIRQGIAGQSSFAIHLPLAAAVVAFATILNVSLEHWCILILCIGIVLTAELFNSSLEWICRSITGQIDPDIERALNIASGAVLATSITAAIVGCIVFLSALL